MSAHNIHRSQVDRRALLVGSLAAGPLGAALPTTDDELVKRGMAWLAMDAQARRLMTRWGSLEGRAMRSSHHWNQLTDAERVATSFGAEMSRIDGELTGLFRRREIEFEQIEQLPARTPSGVIAKLAVASRLLEVADSEAAPLVADALAAMEALYLRAMGANVRT